MAPINRMPPQLPAAAPPLTAQAARVAELLQLKLVILLTYRDRLEEAVAQANAHLRLYMRPPGGGAGPGWHGVPGAGPTSVRRVTPLGGLYVRLPAVAVVTKLASCLSPGCCGNVAMLILPVVALPDQAPFPSPAHAPLIKCLSPCCAVALPPAAAAAHAGYIIRQLQVHAACRSA